MAKRVKVEWLFQLTLTEVSKLECQLKVNKPEDGSSPYEINDTAAVED